MPQTFANSINNNLIYADRAEHDAAGNDIATTYATKQEIPSVPVTDVEVDGVSVVSSGVASITMPTFTQAQANWNESDTSAASYIQNKPSIPSATSDLTNDSGFITLSDVPAQVNADWDAVSGAAEILNKPTINNVPAVTSSDDNKVLKASYTGGVGSYSWENESTEVPSYTTSEDGKVLGVVDNQGTAELQWVTGGGSSTSDVYVMDGTEPFNDIWNKYQAGTVIYYWTTKPNSSAVYEPYLVTNIRANDSAHTSGTITYTCLDRQSTSLLFNLYSGVSSGYASGFGVVSKNSTQLTLGGSDGQTLVFNSYGHLAPATINQVPAATSADADKVLTVNAQGTPAWASAQAPISAGTGIDITNNVVSVDTSVVATQTDLATKEDAFDVGTGLEMDTSGVTPTLQVEAPVDIVAGPGIVIDNPDGNTLRVSQAYPTDETVLWSGILYQVGDTYTQNLSETVRNFSKIQFWVRRRFQAPSAGRCYFTPTVVLTFESTNNALAYIDAVDIASGTFAQNCIYVQFPTDTTVKLLAGTKFSGGTYSNNVQTYEFSIEKIIGIHRIQGGS